MHWQLTLMLGMVLSIVVRATSGGCSLLLSSGGCEHSSIVTGSNNVKERCWSNYGNP